LALATESADEAVPGTVIDEELTVRCADGALRLLSLQRAGRKAMSATNFLRGYQLDRGTILPVPLN
jgi:methionyl-tRNA formyltransferase